MASNKWIRGQERRKTAVGGWGWGGGERGVRRGHEEEGSAKVDIQEWRLFSGQVC